MSLKTNYDHTKKNNSYYITEISVCYWVLEISLNNNLRCLSIRSVNWGKKTKSTGSVV